MEFLKYHYTRFFIFGLVTSTMLISCSFGNYIKTISDIKYQDPEQFRHDGIRTDGYYIAEDLENSPEELLFFFEDGGYMTSCNYLRYHHVGTQDVNWDNLYEYYGYSKKNNQWKWDFGVYTKHGDIIEANRYEPYYFVIKPLYFYWMLTKSKYRLIDSDTIEMVYYINMIHEEVLKEMHDTIGVLSSPRRYHFVKSDHLPFSDMRYRKLKWMWEKRELWEKYLKEQKQKGNNL
jgi:hypothetical protein